ncbi:hypothetical protein PRIPAC_70168 [Pristionchus pacificus]|uniref:RRP15-like protein n=1 Tax=Pristionchus pacificus TaxID=54126 RepID=A0A2A6C1V4_PRIPA|nr:hypothetical protein PRIPAC_70168 [Pristionchus pacificus]|eukprot:PDM72087.1 hypothetical protein PRIPAC_38494 [Pristionchus pacificus]
MAVVRGSGQIEIRESSEESDAAVASSSEEDREHEEEEDAGVDKQKPLKTKTVSFPNPRRALERRATKKELSVKQVQKQNAMKLGFTKPDVVRDRVKERTLRRIATSGVAQLFNAVTERQKSLDVEIQKHQKGGKLKKEKLSTTLNFGPPGVVKPKKEEVEDWLNDSHGEEDVKEEAMEE